MSLKVKTFCSHLILHFQHSNKASMTSSQLLKDSQEKTLIQDCFRNYSSREALGSVLTKMERIKWLNSRMMMKMWKKSILVNYKKFIHNTQVRREEIKLYLFSLLTLISL
jgi:hypothetical protein